MLIWFALIFLISGFLLAEQRHLLPQSNSDLIRYRSCAACSFLCTGYRSKEHLFLYAQHLFESSFPSLNPQGTLSGSKNAEPISTVLYTLALPSLLILLPSLIFPHLTLTKYCRPNTLNAGSSNLRCAGDVPQSKWLK